MSCKLCNLCTCLNCLFTIITICVACIAEIFTCCSHSIDSSCVCMSTNRSCCFKQYCISAGNCLTEFCGNTAFCNCRAVCTGNEVVLQAVCFSLCEARINKDLAFSVFGSSSFNPKFERQYICIATILRKHIC